MFGTPSVSTIRTHTTVPQLLASPSYPTPNEVEHNVVASFQKKRPRWDDKTNKFLGLCREHGSETSIEFTSEEDLATLFEDLAHGNIHLASEATVGAVRILSPHQRLYSAHPIVLSGSCKREGAEQHAKLLQDVLGAANNKQAFTGVRMVSLASDGESRRGKALAQLTYVKPISSTSPIYQHLVHMELFDTFVGADDITADKDYKHIFKRLRNTLLRGKGSLDSGLSSAHIQYVLDPKDKQDVVLAYKLLKDLWSLPPADLGASNQPYVETRNALRLYGQLSYHLIFPYICVDLSLSEQLEHLSTAIHLLLALYVHGDARSQFIPNSLFVDIGIMVKNVYICVAKAKVDHPSSPFFIILLGTDRLESLFGILRTMVGNDTNLDILQLTLRVTSTTEVSNILAKHPEWDKSPRRLRLPTVSKNMAEISSSADYTSPRAFANPEKLRPSGMTPATSWKCGRRLLEERHKWAAPILQHISGTPNASILAPYGTSMIILNETGDDGDSEAEGDPSMSDRDPSPLLPPSNLLDTTAGMRELEDSATDIDWRDKTHSEKVPFSNVVQVGGVAMNKSRAIAQRFRYVTSASSTDRLRCIAQESRFKATGSYEHTLSGDSGIDGPILSVLQPIATLVFCEHKLFLCIAEVNGLFLDSRSVDGIPVAILLEKIAEVSYQALRLVPANASDDPGGNND
ncbi:hypothetical protein BC826DRAFT_1110696 [Russula brevipes]|nr:hypothetical protein BC826DRAFT_1110696 [Russula brevipes]